MKHTLLLIILLLSCSACCPITKTSNRKKTVSEIHQFKQKDSCKIDYLLQNKLIQKVQWKHITLSPPDSTGKQHLQSITIATTDTQEETIQQSTLENTTTATLQEVTEKTQEKQTQKKFPTLLILVLVGGGIVFLSKTYSR